MKRRSFISLGLHSTLLVLLIMSAGLSRTAYGRSRSVRLFLQQTPLQGGIISPSAGLYHYEPNAQITLSAIPEPGYDFVYWLGDVSDPTACNTTVYLNGSKVVVAVFEPTEYDSAGDKQPLASGGGGAMAMPSIGDYGRQGFISTSGRPPDSSSSPQVQVTIPEPATLVLLGLGGIILRRRKRA
jgi:hypothetical protein